MSLNSPWNSLEIAKLAVSLFSALIFLYLGLRVNRAAQQLEASQWINQKIIEKRLALYDQIAPLLNDLYCFYVRVGGWKEVTPPQVIEIKHRLDRLVSVNSPLFSNNFRRAYDQFMLLCFDMLVAENRDAQLRTLTDQRTALPGWREEWQPMFSEPSSCPPPYQVLAAYEELMARFAKELGIR
jgi:hypothetical protein